MHIQFTKCTIFINLNTYIFLHKFTTKIFSKKKKKIQGENKKYHKTSSPNNIHTKQQQLKQRKYQFENVSLLLCFPLFSFSYFFILFFLIIYFFLVNAFLFFNVFSFLFFFIGIYAKTIKEMGETKKKKNIHHQHKIAKIHKTLLGIFYFIFICCIQDNERLMW